MNKKKFSAAAGAVVLGAIFVKEMMTPFRRRHWEGKLLGVVPYALRLPTRRQIKDSVWNPDDSRVLVPMAFGIGWSVNLARLLGRTRTGDDIAQKYAEGR